MRQILRQLRGALGNAIVWGASWCGAVFALMTGAYLGGFLPSGDTWLLIISFSANLGITGFLTGGVFSVYLRAAYRGRAIDEIEVGGMALGGTLIGALFSTAVAFLTGSSAGVALMPANPVVGGMCAAVLGAVTASTCIRLAKGASRELTAAAKHELEKEQGEVVALLADPFPAPALAPDSTS